MVERLPTSNQSINYPHIIYTTPRSGFYSTSLLTILPPSFLLPRRPVSIGTLHSPSQALYTSCPLCLWQPPYCSHGCFLPMVLPSASLTHTTTSWTHRPLMYQIVLCASVARHPAHPASPPLGGELRCSGTSGLSSLCPEHCEVVVS